MEDITVRLYVDYGKFRVELFVGGLWIWTVYTDQQPVLTALKAGENVTLNFSDDKATITLPDKE